MNIAILGYEDLSAELASLWGKKGHHITLATYRPEQLPLLSRSVQKSLILKGNGEEDLPSLLATHETILIALAPDHPEAYEMSYLDLAQSLRHIALEMNLPRQLLHLSSTFVYGDHQGLWVDEMSPLHAKGEHAKIAIEAEKTYSSLEEIGWFVATLRLAEIYGPKKTLSRRLKQLENHVVPGSGEQYTNMVHHLDAVNAIDYAFRHHFEGIYNVADDDHPTRKELYDELARRFHHSKLKWDPTLAGYKENRRVSNHKIKAEGFFFHYPHRVLE